MAGVAANITNTLMSAPLPLLIEKLGMAIATAQVALDRNSLAMASSMASGKITIDGKEQNLISLGFAPTFYAFTEATIEAKLEFTLAESDDFSISAGVGFNLGGNNNSNNGGQGGGMSDDKNSKTGVIAVSVNAAYARKFEMSAEGSSSIAARMISLPPPDRFRELLTEISGKTDIAVTGIEVSTGIPAVTSLAAGQTLQLYAELAPADTTDTGITWQLVTNPPASAQAQVATITAGGLLSALAAGTATVKAVSTGKPAVYGTLNLTIN